MPKYAARAAAAPERPLPRQGAEAGQSSRSSTDRSARAARARSPASRRRACLIRRRWSCKPAWPGSPPRHAGGQPGEGDDSEQVRTGQRRRPARSRSSKRAAARSARTCLNIANLHSRSRRIHVRPGLHGHGGLRKQDHVHRRRRRRPAAPRLPDRAARRQVELPRGRLPADERRTADRDAARAVRPLDPLSHDAERDAAAFLQRLPLRRAPDGDGVRGRRLDGGVLSRLDGHP